MDSSPSAFMKSFFAELPDLEELAPDALATEYVKYCYSRLDELPSLVAPAPSSNIFLMDDRTSLSFVTTRSMLVSDTTILSHQSGPRKHVVAQNFVGRVYGPSTLNVYRLLDNFYFCPDLHELGEWLQAARPLLDEGNMFYSPHFTYEGPVDDARRQRVSSFERLRDALIVHRRVLDKLSKKSLKAGLMKPILKLDLPTLEKVDLPTFAKITVDENEALTNFRHFLHGKLLDIDAARGSESYDRALKKLSWDIEDRVRKLDSETQKMTLKGWFQATGAVVATCTALLIALDQPTLASLASVGGGGGALWLVTKAMEEMISRRRDLKDSPVFYMWLLSKSVPKR